jgi:hypothetical protein
MRLHTTAGIRSKLRCASFLQASQQLRASASPSAAQTLCVMLSLERARRGMLCASVCLQGLPMGSWLQGWAGTRGDNRHGGGQGGAGGWGLAHKLWNLSQCRAPFASEPTLVNLAQEHRGVLLVCLGAPQRSLPS